MNEFTKAIYRYFKRNENESFLKISDKDNIILKKLNMLLESEEYLVISNKLQIEDVKGFIDYHLEYFDKWYESIGANAKNYYKNRNGQEANKKNDIKRIEDFKNFLECYKINEFETKFKKHCCIGFLNELLQDIHNKTQRMAVYQRDFKLKTTSQKIIQELQETKLYTKREIESYSKCLSKIKSS